MEACSSGEDLIVKMRKPYTITKQRERWTEDEHKRFLEALKIYGRAWQRIEEHIGTKTAVQIRSHAQKFFSKLEKEASNNGVPLSHALDIDIPPPRPKRKPSNPYPRKTSKSAAYSPGESTRACLYKEQLHFGRDSASEIDQKAAGNEKLERTKMASDSGGHSDVLSLLPDTVCGSISCMSKFSGDEHLSQKRVLVPKLVVTNAESKSSPIMEEDIERWQSCAECSDVGDGKLGCLCLKLQKQTALLGLPVAGAEKMPESLQSNLQRCHDPPNVVALNSVEENKQNSGQSTGCDTRTATSVSQKIGDYTSLNAFSDPSMLAASQQFINSSSTQQLSWFHPFAPFHEKLNAHDSFFHMSSAFSNLLVSTLLQNPAAHAAACFAASFLPSTDQESSLNPTSDTSIGGIPSRNLYAPPSVSAITAATVAAATAWWTSHGLFSTYNLPFTAGLAFSSGPATRDSSCPQRKAGSENNARNEKDGHVEVKEDHQMLKPGGSPEVLTTELCTSKISPLSSLDSNDSGRVENPRDIEQKDFDETGQLLPSARVGDHDSNQNSKGNKKHDRSSCGSNTASSSEENDALLEKLDEGEQLKQKVAHASEAASESAYRRCRNGGSINEQWKEVSEEGRLAFQALFSREVLPQSFSPPQAEDAAVKLNKQENENSTLLVDLNRKYSDFDRVHVVDEAPSSGSKSLFVTKTMQGRSKTCQTGFKPYKRCSVEVVEDRSSTIEEKCNKRIRSDGACSTIS